MIAQLTTDRGISTIQSSVFNYDRQKRETLDLVEARDIMNYDVLVKPCRDEHGNKLGINYLVNSRTDTVIESYGVGAKFTPYQNYKMFDYITNDVMPLVPELKP